MQESLDIKVTQTDEGEPRANCARIKDGKCQVEIRNTDKISTHTSEGKKSGWTGRKIKKKKINHRK